MAAVVAEPEPQVLLNSPIYPYVPTIPYYQPLQYVEKPAEVEEKVSEDKKVVLQYAKAPFYNPYFQPYVQPLAVKTYANDAEKPDQYAAKGQYRAENAGAVHVAKREADPYYYYNAVNPYAVNPYAVNPYAVNPYAANPYLTVPYVKPYAYANVFPYNWQPKTYANDAVKPEQYAAKGQYVAQSAGAIHVAKREAEPDPQLLYRSVYNAVPYYYNQYNYQPYTVARVYSQPAYYPYYNYYL